MTVTVTGYKVYYIDVGYKRQRIPKGQLKMDNPERLAT